MLQCFISISIQLKGLWDFSSVYPRPPRILSCTLTLWLGEPDKKQLLPEYFWSHMWPSFFPKTRSSHMCVYFLWTWFRVCVMSILSCLTYTHKILSILSIFLTKCISFSKHETQILFLVLWIEVTHSAFH